MKCEKPFFLKSITFLILKVKIRNLIQKKEKQLKKKKCMRMVLKDEEVGESGKVENR